MISRHKISSIIYTHTPRLQGLPQIHTDDWLLAPLLRDFRYIHQTLGRLWYETLSLQTTLCVRLQRCASCCVVECWIGNREVPGSNHGLGYFAPRSTQPSIPPGSVNEYQLRLGRQRYVWLIQIADEHAGVQVKLWPLRTRAIPERFCGGDSLRKGAISSVWILTEVIWFGSKSLSDRDKAVVIAKRNTPAGR